METIFLNNCLPIFIHEMYSKWLIMRDGNCDENVLFLDIDEFNFENLKNDNIIKQVYMTKNLTLHGLKYDDDDRIKPKMFDFINEYLLNDIVKNDDEFMRLIISIVNMIPSNDIGNIFESDIGKQCVDDLNEFIHDKIRIKILDDNKKKSKLKKINKLFHTISYIHENIRHVEKTYTMPFIRSKLRYPTFIPFIYCIRFALIEKMGILDDEQKAKFERLGFIPTSKKVLNEIPVGFLLQYLPDLKTGYNKCLFVDEYNEALKTLSSPTFSIYVQYSKEKIKKSMDIYKYNRNINKSYNHHDYNETYEGDYRLQAILLCLDDFDRIWTSELFLPLPSRDRLLRIRSLRAVNWKPCTKLVLDYLFEL